MNQQLQNELFKEFQPEEYYARHFKQKIRTDGRKLQQSRLLSLTLNSFTNCNGSCVLRRGGSMIICQIKAQAKEFPISPLSNTFGIPLINVETSLSDRRHITYLDQARKQSYISYEVEQFLKRYDAIKKLCFKENHKTYGYVFNIDLRILEEDGSVLPLCVLCTELALFTTRLPQLKIENGNLMQTPNSQTFLELTSFLFPICYAEVFGQLLIDPSEEEERDGSFIVQVLWELKELGKTEKPASLKKLGKSGIEQPILQKIVQLSKIEVSKINIDYVAIRQRLTKGDGEITIQIS